MGAVSPSTLGLAILDPARLPATFAGAVAAIALHLKYFSAIGPAAKNAGHVRRLQVLLLAHVDEVGAGMCR